MALWVDKYRPTELKNLSYHLEQGSRLAQMVKNDDFPHILFYGPSGAGKKTRIRCTLRELYGPGVDRLRLETKSFTAPSGKKLDIQTVSSNYHIELSPGDVGIYDRVVVQEVVKQMAQSPQLDTSLRAFKVVVLMEVDRLTRDAQHALRRTMEKYSGNCRLILCCEALSRVIEPLHSRCMAIRVAAPSDDDIRSAVTKVCKDEGVAVPPSVMLQVIEKSNGNMRRALLMIEATKVQSNPIKDNQKVPEPEWEQYIRETAALIIQKQNNDNVLAVRERLYEVISRCIPPNVLFVQLLRCLLPYCTPHAKLEAIEVAAQYEHRLCRGQKAIFHLEAFVCAFMEIYLASQNKAMEH